MNWSWLRLVPWIDTRAAFVARVPRGGALLDLGSSDGETLRHIAQLRPDLKLFSADKVGHPERYPAGCEFFTVDFEADKLPWADSTMDAVTCMHVVEHLREHAPLVGEVARMLKPGGRAYFETPHARSLTMPSAKGRFTLNFYDDPTHVRLIDLRELCAHAQAAGLVEGISGVSRNWLFAAAHALFIFMPESRKKFTARIHWAGWSAFQVLSRPA
jgi:2-polyprenyl-3-methyl-5-hydroxy-6-metoxy-1,4-benzoquinol methylase